MSDNLTFHQTKEYQRWLRKQPRDARERIRRKMKELGETDDMNLVASLTKPLGGGLHEVKAGGLRVYYAIEGVMMVLLCGGTKDTTKEQHNDISHARELLAKRSAAGIAGERTHGR